MDSALEGAASGAAAGTAISPGWGTVIGAGLGLLGGMMSDSSREEAAEKNASLQREFAQHGIQWRVADAKAAGVHPLFALGASTAQASPVYSGSTIGQSLGEMGQGVARAAVAQQQAEIQERQLQLQELTSKASAAKDFALAQATLSEIARREQENQLSMPGAVDRAYVYAVPNNQDGIRMVPLEGIPPVGSYRERRAGSGGGKSASDVVTGQTLKGAPSDMATQYGPGDRLGKWFYLPFTVPVETEFGASEYQAKIWLPSSKEPGSAEPIEALEGVITGAGFAALNAAKQGRGVWEATVAAYDRLKAEEKRYIAERLRRRDIRSTAGRIREPIRDYPYPNRR